MRYKCIGSPDCMKSFEYGHALRAHIAACDKAQKILKSQAEIEKVEKNINLEYPGIYGLHRNPHYPTSHHLDQTLRYDFADKNRFSPKESQEKALKPIRNPYLMTSNQMKKILANE
ncbi:hypothetical protein BpHYR1_034557 [Brachionus plicatilis]|uniref:Uncharacterized protein n=1 Tax=Brachionus plicatilis TaxID=10195 RepID=A0A3M7R192_BRAPC|nr:hypothetical protein BpHYR1_034557 [Brachionus plicatilis]